MPSKRGRFLFENKPTNQTAPEICASFLSRFFNCKKEGMSRSQHSNVFALMFSPFGCDQRCNWMSTKIMMEPELK